MGLGRLKKKRSDADPEVEGQSLVEYALIIVLIVFVTMSALILAADAIMSLWQEIRDVIVPAFGG